MNDTHDDFLICDNCKKEITPLLRKSMTEDKGFIYCSSKCTAKHRLHRKKKKDNPYEYNCVPKNKKVPCEREYPQYYKPNYPF